MRPPPSEPSPATWDCILPGPPSKNNGGSADLSPAGILAYASGSCVAILDIHSMQLASTIPLPPPPSSAVSPFITAVRWSPISLPHHLLESENSSPHLQLAVGDRHGRICLLDFRSKAPALFFDNSSPNFSKLGVQDLCWIQTRLDSWCLAAISGPSLLSIYDANTGRCFFKYDASPEYFSCIRRDPFFSGHFCVLGLRGLLLSVKLLGDESENDVVLKELQIRTDTTEFQRLEKDSAAGSNNGAPVSSLFPNYTAKFAFSPHWKHVILVAFPRELVSFDLQYNSALFTAGLPRGYGKFLEVLPDVNMEVFYCVHLDGKLSTWRHKESEQVHIMYSMDELMPSIGTAVPSPLVLAVAVSQPDYTLQDIHRLCTETEPFDSELDNPFVFFNESHIISKTHIISVSDDGKVWKWLLTAERFRDSNKDSVNCKKVEVSVSEVGSMSEVSSAGQSTRNKMTQPDILNFRENRQLGFSVVSNEVTFKMDLVGQLHLLSSAISMLAVPSPSLTASLAPGGNSPAVAVPLVALGTQSGTIDVIDVSANAVASSFSVHSGMVRGLRWLGNSKLVSFSYTQASEKTGGYVNRLVVTCLRSGLHRTFRVMQKPERAPIRALRASPSGRYLLMLFRDAPVEVWAMTKTPIMLRSLALPFTVLEWTLPTVPKPAQNKPSRTSSILSRDGSGKSPETSSSTKAASTDTKEGADGAQDEFSESFAFALVNGALGVFEVQGRRIRDFKPKWPTTSFVSSDGLVTAMAYRLPHVVMGDRSGNIRWWDVGTGQSSSFNTHRDGIRRIKFSPVVPGDRSRGRIAVLFYDNTFSVFDLDSPDPLANSLLQPQFPGTLVLELDWLPLRTDKDDPLALCIAGADSSFRLVQLNVGDQKTGPMSPRTQPINERFRPVPLASPVILPTPHALAFRMILQLGVKPSWFNTFSSIMNEEHSHVPGTPSAGDLRGYMIDPPHVGDSAVPEMLLKVLEPYRREACLFDDERVRLYSKVVKRGTILRLAFAAAVFGESMEALFWLQLPHALNHLLNKLADRSPQKVPHTEQTREIDEASILSRISSKRISLPDPRNILVNGQLKSMAFDQQELWELANERITWHEKLEGEEAVQNRVHELVSVGNLEAAVSLLLSTSPDSSYNALRAVALSSAVSTSLLELAVKVVAANMVRNDRSLSGTHLLCAVGRYQEACSQLQDAGYWTDAATLAATHLSGSDYARVMQRWADHVLHVEHNIWRALILYVSAGALQEALTALRSAQLPDTAAMFVFVSREIHAEFLAELDAEEESASLKEKVSDLPGLNPSSEDVVAVCEFFGQYQRKLVHLCMDSEPYPC